MTVDDLRAELDRIEQDNLEIGDGHGVDVRNPLRLCRALRAALDEDTDTGQRGIASAILRAWESE